jgi:hypothetical protein
MPTPILRQMRHAAQPPTKTYTHLGDSQCGRGTRRHLTYKKVQDSTPSQSSKTRSYIQLAARYLLPFSHTHTHTHTALSTHWKPSAQHWFTLEPPEDTTQIEERGRGQAFPITTIRSPYPTIAAASPCFTSRPTDFF